VHRGVIDRFPAPVDFLELVKQLEVAFGHLILLLRGMKLLSDGLVLVVLSPEVSHPIKIFTNAWVP